MKKQIPIISFEHTSFQYEGQIQENLRDVNLTIKSGEFLVITGQSGCGKTTLTRCINNLIPRFFEGVLSGEVIVSGRSIKESDAGEAGKEIASIFQDPRSQFFTTNSSSEVAFACENYGIPHEEIVKRVDRAFQSLDMENLKDRDIFTLSSGERQKIAFLAATTLNPQIYVLDEPSANLDIHAILQMRKILSALKAAGHTIIVSEHRLFYLYGLADRFLIMKEGRICEELTGEEMAKLSASQMRSRRLRPLNLNTIQIEKIEPIGHSEVFLQIKNMSFSHKAMPELLHSISIEAHKGETIALVGENGCGKTTFGKILSGLIRCRQGGFFKEIEVGSGGNDFDIADKITASNFRQKKTGENTHEIESRPEVSLPTPNEVFMDEAVKKKLSEIIDEINAAYNKNFDVDVASKSALQMRDILLKNGHLRDSARNNSLKDFRFAYFDAVQDALIAGYEQNQDFFALLLDNGEKKRELMQVFLEDVYRNLRT